MFTMACLAGFLAIADN